MILRDQLHVTQEDFWACVRDGVRPERGLVRAPAESLPVELAYLLVHRVGLPDAEVAGLTKDQAVKILNDYWAAGSGD
ncbi:MAG TPA: hypothetical protein VES42_25320 [Pilimelia sp.]|nr:hypothetical protein [Pilimelia sp.]